MERENAPPVVGKGSVTIVRGKGVMSLARYVMRVMEVDSVRIAMGQGNAPNVKEAGRNSE